MISIDYTLIIVILNFGLLIYLLRNLVYKGISKYLSERQQQIEDEMKQAEVNKEKAASLVKEKEAELKESMQEAKKIKDRAKHDAEKEASDIIHHAKNEEKKIMKDTEMQLQHEKQKVLKELESQMTDYIADLAEKVLGEKVNSKEDVKLIKNAIADRSE